jgi:exopolysaccharide biosynthesis polyprenyl glycosylphosphotransferase
MKNFKKLTVILFIGLTLISIPSQLTKASPAETVSPKPLSLYAEPHSQAPEPSSLILFGSGIFTMIMAFLRRAYHISKRIMDIVISCVAVVLLAPLCLLTALLIKLTSKGPIFYSQTRSGKDGVDFEIYKFRTMRTDAEKATGPVWAQVKDSRITPIGSFLRKSRIDEIPQFINVLKGDMSVIGPRPERPIFVEKLEGQIKDYRKRLAVKPGITGLAQVNHRYDESIADVRKKVKYDILYIKKICFLTDIRIILHTVRVILTGFGAR